VLLYAGNVRIESYEFPCYAYSPDSFFSLKPSKSSFIVFHSSKYTDNVLVVADGHKLIPVVHGA